MKDFKYRYYFLPISFTAFADIGVSKEYKTSQKIIVREKIDLIKSIFSNNGKGKYTFVEFPGHGINDEKDNVDLYGNGSLYIERKQLIQVPLLFNAKKKFQEQIENYIQDKKTESVKTNDMKDEKIKVGQIRKDKFGLYVVTNFNVEDYRFTIIYQDGVVGNWTEEPLEDDELIASYSTWQEAVNSHEFKGEK